MCCEIWIFTVVGIMCCLSEFWHHVLLLIGVSEKCTVSVFRAEDEDWVFTKMLASTCSYTPYQSPEGEHHQNYMFFGLKKPPHFCHLFFCNVVALINVCLTDIRIWILTSYWFSSIIYWLKNNNWENHLVAFINWGLRFPWWWGWRWSCGFWLFISVGRYWCLG